MKDQKVGIIIQARMGSTRLPGKVLKFLDSKETVLDVLIKRMKICKKVDEIIIATTPDKNNYQIIDVAKIYDLFYFVGSENNVLERYYKCAKEHNLDIIVRITSDCPFVDPKIVDDMIVFFQDNMYNYITTHYVKEESAIPDGLGVEIFSFNTLEKIYLNATSIFDKEHVSTYIRSHPEDFTVFNYSINIKKIDYLRLTIDEKEDLIMCRMVYKKLKENSKSIDFSIYDILNIIENNPKFIDINKHLVLKKK